jgi:hypothetical protein
MTELTLEMRLDRLEREVRHLEDQLDIYRILASYGPAVDTRSEEAVAALWAEDGRYDYGGRPHVGAQDVATLVNNDAHVDYVGRGCAHVISMPLVQVRGDQAVATGYSRVYLHAEDGWKVERASANRWEFVRTADGWKVKDRVNRLLDGSSEARALLRRGVTPSRA